MGFKKLASMFVLSAATLLTAGVMEFQNFERDGKPVLIPEVQNYEAVSGTFKLPGKLVVALPEGEQLILEQIAAELKRFGGSAVAGDNAVCRFTLTESGVPVHKEGYTLTVSAEGITVAARTTDGLFRGAQTLRNLLANAATPELKCCRITDYPDFELRGYTFNLRSIPSKNLPLVKRNLEAMARLKLNTAFITLEECFPFTNNPYTKRRNVYTLEQVRDLVAFCDARHIKIVPTLQVLSHAAWMTSHPEWDKMKEGVPDKHWNSMPCPQNEQARELVKTAIEEHIAVFKPEIFNICYDEIFLCPFRSCPRCKATDPHKILADYLAFVQGVLDKHGVKMMVCQDCFKDNPRWPYGDWYRTLLRKETYINWWSYRDQLDEESMRIFSAYRPMGNAICGKPFNVYNMAHLVKKCGGSYCKMTYWYYSSDGLLARLETETPDSLGGFVNGCDYLWKLREKPYQYLGYDGTFAMMRITHPEMLTLPKRTGEYQPVPLENAVNADLSATDKFPNFSNDREVEELAAALANLPERFRLVTSPGGRYYAARLAPRRDLGRRGIAIDFGGRKMEQLALLLTASRPSNGDDYYGHHYGKKRFIHDPAAALTINYTDGTKAAIPLRYRQELTDWNRPFGGFNMRFAVRGVDADKRYYSFGICDVKNPHLEKAVKTIAFGAHDMDGISPALLALSAWGVDKPFAAPKNAFDPAVLEKRRGVREDAPDRGLRIVRDFKDGLKDITFLDTLSKQDFKYDIIDDPTSPAKGKVLRIRIPQCSKPGDQGDRGYLRFSIYMPYQVPAGTKSALLDYKVVAAEGDFSHGNDYFVAEGKLGQVRPYRMYPFRMPAGDRGWQRQISSSYSTHEFTLKDISKTRYRRVSFFFHRLTAPAEIWIGNLGDTTENISLAPLWREGAEAEPI